jgi:hypothetical protein
VSGTPAGGIRAGLSNEVGRDFHTYPFSIDPLIE